MESINTQRDLFERWKATEKHKGHHFIEDGIIDPDRWESAQIKILFLLKEAYGSIPDLTEFIRDHSNLKKGTWKRCACWAHIVLSKEPMKFEEIVEDEQAKRNALLSCAVVNIKKSGGNSESDMKDIFGYAETDAALLREQIKILRPDLIISGGVFACWEEIWPAQPINKQERRIWTVGQTVAFNFCHPASVYPDDFMYFSMMKLMNDARGMGLLTVPKD